MAISKSWGVKKLTFSNAGFFLQWKINIKIYATTLVNLFIDENLSNKYFQNYISSLVMDKLHFFSDFCSGISDSIWISWIIHSSLGHSSYFELHHQSSLFKSSFRQQPQGNTSERLSPDLDSKNNLFSNFSYSVVHESLTGDTHFYPI